VHRKALSNRWNFPGQPGDITGSTDYITSLIEDLDSGNITFKWSLGNKAVIGAVRVDGLEGEISFRRPLAPFIRIAGPDFPRPADSAYVGGSIKHTLI
jgi:hypothetical protein